MKHLTLKQLTITNFWGIKYKVIDFSRPEIFVYGDNATGKSTLFDAFCWLLFSKEQFDRKDYEIITIINGYTLKKVDAEVSAIIDADGEEISLKKILRQNWVTPRGQIDDVLKGHETRCYYNDIPLKVGEFKVRIDGLINETVFKLITNPVYFIFSKDMTWQKQREYLFQMAGDISDSDIVALRPEYAALFDKISGKSFDEYKRAIAARRKKIKDDLETIPVRIDQTWRMMPESVDFNARETELAGINANIENINKCIGDISAASAEQNKKNLARQEQINTWKTEQQILIPRAEATERQKAYEANQTREILSYEVERIKREISEAGGDYDRLSRNSDILKKQILNDDDSVTNLRTKWQKENEAKYIEPEEDCLKCPVFGITYTDSEALEKHRENRKLARDAFNAERKKAKEDIDQKGIALAEEQARNRERLKQIFIEMTFAEKRISELFELRDTTQISAQEVIPKNIAEWVALQKKIEELEGQAKEGVSEDTTFYETQKKEIETWRDKLKIQLSKREDITRVKNEIVRLENENCDLAQQLDDIDKDIFAIHQFTKAKSDECTRRIREMFSLVEFQLFDTTLDGNESPNCIAKNRAGVPIASTNTAEQINAGLDIINALCRFHGVTAPIFIDGRESVNRLIFTESQIINLIVSEDKELIIK